MISKDVNLVFYLSVYPFVHSINWRQFNDIDLIHKVDMIFLAMICTHVFFISVWDIKGSQVIISK